MRYLRISHKILSEIIGYWRFLRTIPNGARELLLQYGKACFRFWFISAAHVNSFEKRLFLAVSETFSLPLMNHQHNAALAALVAKHESFESETVVLLCFVKRDT
jgi:hypothetical protein